MPTVEPDGARIWYADMGQGTPVLLVHGGLFDPAASDFFWVESGVAADLVAAGFRIVMPDRRFSGGRTTAPFAMHTWDVEAADLAAILRQARAAPAHVVTGSNGCSAAIRLALTEPTLVRVSLCHVGRGALGGAMRLGYVPRLPKTFPRPPPPVAAGLQ